MELLARFTSKYLPEPNTGCWLWHGSFFTDGYGAFWAARRNRRASHISHELFKGPIPVGLSVLHKCDTPECVNPDHLWLGTQKDNMDDMARKGRRRGHFKLTPTQVDEIRSRWVQAPKRGLKRAMAKEFKVTESAIGRIIFRKVWMSR